MGIALMASADLPPPFPPAIMRCASAAATEYNVPRILLLAIIKTESSGNVRAINHNSNGTRDVGPMQINTIWAQHLESRYGIDNAAHHLSNNYCYNIRVGAWILNGEIGGINAGRFDPDEYWRRVGNYHSKKPKFNNVYRAKVMNNLRWLVKHTKWWD